MSESGWRVALIDSGLDARLRPLDACRFVDDGAAIRAESAAPDRLGHGTLMAGIIGSAAVPLQWLNAQVFDAQRRTTAACVAAAIDWAVARGAHLIHLSLGLRDDRAVLADAVAAALAAGRIIVASTPARGEVSFPARYAGVLRATGDARCSTDEISNLAGGNADFGGCPRVDGRPGAGGASLGAAHVSRFIARHLSAAGDAARLRADLARLARYHGPENKTAP
jgi:subtilisin family serine protease